MLFFVIDWTFLSDAHAIQIINRADEILSCIKLQFLMTPNFCELQPTHDMTCHTVVYFLQNQH